MRTVWQSLAWKEWHEHKWKLAAIIGVLCGVTGIALLSLLKERNASLDGFMPALVLGMIPLTLFIAAGEAAGENSARTMPFLQSLPIPLWKAAAWKLVFGAVTCLVPVLITLALISTWFWLAEAWGKKPETALWTGNTGLIKGFTIGGPLLTWNTLLFVLAGVTSLSLLIWGVTIGVNRKSETAAASVGLVIMIAWWSAVLLVVRFAGWQLDAGHFGARAIVVCLCSASPAGLMAVFLHPSLAMPLFLVIGGLVALIAHCLLVGSYLRRFGKVGLTAYSREVARPTAGLDWLGRPRRSPFTAIMWKQFRESGPIALVGLAAILFFVAVTVLADEQDSSDELARLILGLTGNIGFLVVLIVGIGVFDRDLSPKLHTFWRSRPINPDLWYWTKYLTGITVIAVVLLIPAGIAGYLSSSGLSNPPGQPTPFAVLMMVVSVFAAVYALSVATICLIRMTIYAAILSAGMLAVGTGVLWFFMDIMDMELSELLVTAIVMALTVAVLAALVGWWAVRRDVGWRK